MKRQYLRRTRYAKSKNDPSGYWSFNREAGSPDWVLTFIEYSDPQYLKDVEREREAYAREVDIIGMSWAQYYTDKHSDVKPYIRKIWRISRDLRRRIFSKNRPRKKRYKK